MTNTRMVMRHMGRMDKHHVHPGAMCFLFAIKIAPFVWHKTTGIKRQKHKTKQQS